MTKRIKQKMLREQRASARRAKEMRKRMKEMKKQKPVEHPVVMTVSIPVKDATDVIAMTMGGLEGKFTHNGKEVEFNTRNEALGRAILFNIGKHQFSIEVMDITRAIIAGREW